MALSVTEGVGRVYNLLRSAREAEHASPSRGVLHHWMITDVRKVMILLAAFFTRGRADKVQRSVLDYSKRAI